MCYSALLLRSYTDYCRAYGVHMQADLFVELFQERTRQPGLRIPVGLGDQLVAMGGTAGRAIEVATRRWQAIEAERIHREIAEAESAIVLLEAKKPGKTRDRELAAKRRKRERLLAGLQPPSPTDSLRIYPYYFAPVVIEDGGRRLVPMRYRLLPANGIEVPGQYNVFNARRDSLRSARTWRAVFGRKHALFPFTRFYEWVAGPDGKPVELSFAPDGFEMMWAAALYDEWTRDTVKRSFAMVTDDPPPEVAAAGHDRCPVFIDRQLVTDWLTPAGKSLNALDALLSRKEPTYYRHTAIAA